MAGMIVAERHRIRQDLTVFRSVSFFSATLGNNSGNVVHFPEETVTQTVAI